MKIYTYIDNIFKQTDTTKLLSLWTSSWEKMGFHTQILNRSIVEKHKYYAKFLRKIKDNHLNITKHKLNRYGEACYVRWLAYASINTKEVFYVSDYDVINKSFQHQQQKVDRLTFLDGYCPSLAMGNSEHFLSFCRDMASHNIPSLQHLGLTTYHDQEFLSLNKRINSRKYNILTSYPFRNNLLKHVSTDYAHASNYYKRNFGDKYDRKNIESTKYFLAISFLNDV